MRVTQSMYYNNIFGNNNSKLNKELFDVNKQIASGLKIQYASDDVRTFTETMRLDNELATIAQSKKSIESGYKVSNQTDVTMNEFTSSMNRMRTLLLQASNGTNDNTSQDAISAELRGIEKNLMSLANTSINGQYLFSGSSIDVKPITDDGVYHGNDVALKSFLGSNNQQKYNISGGEFFLGEESNVNRKITSNVVHLNLLGSSALSDKSQLRDLMGDKNGVSPNTPVFYLRGTRSDGSSFKEKIDTLSDTDTVDSLLKKIENVYGSNTVDVSFSSSGQIVVHDKLKGSSKLDFHLVGAIDYTSSVAGAADVTDIDSLDVAGATTYPPPGNLYVKEFSKSGLISPTSIEGLTYDRTNFTQSGSTLSSNSPQIVKAYNKTVQPFEVLNKNAFAVDATKLSDVADAKEVLPSTVPKTYSLDATQLISQGTNIYGNAITLQIDLKDAGSTFSLDNGTTNYNIYNVDGTQTTANNMTYRQLMDVINMVETKKLPASTATPQDYADATKTSNFFGKTSLSYDGKIQFEDINNAKTQATMNLYDVNANDFTPGAKASVMTFNTNNALTVRDPKTDFFNTINQMIESVENYTNSPNASASSIRTIGIENAIAAMDDLQDHVFRTQSVAGAQSNTLTSSLERTEILEISTMSLRSSVIDTDLAESSLRLSQLTLNYQAMLSTVSKVSQLSLVNYL